MNSYKIKENGLEYLVVPAKETKKRNGEVKITKEKRYCLEVDTSKWEPKHPGDICPDYMLKFCQAKGIKDLEWYVGILNDDKFKKPTKNKSGEVIKTVERKRTPSEVKQEFIKKYFKDMKCVKDEEYKGHAAEAQRILDQMKAEAAATAPAKSK